MSLRRSIVKFIIVVLVLLLEMFVVLQFVSVFRGEDTEWFATKYNFINNRYHVDNEKCEVVHIGVVCMGYESNVDFHNMVKSLYFYRNNPLCFHIMVDDISEKILKTLFETWSVPQVEVIFYKINSFLSNTTWITNGQHYFDLHEYIKTSFYMKIPLNVTSKIIVIETDLTFNGDIYELWNFFHNFDEKQVIGLVETQNGIHVNSEEQTSVVTKGFNTGVILYNLKKLKEAEWSKMLAQVINETVFQGTNKLTNQNAINSIIRKKKNFVYRLPCNWNVQQAENSTIHRCYNNNQIKIVHWNSLKDVQVISEELEYLKSIHTMFLQYNGNLLNKQLYCKKIYKTTPTLNMQHQQNLPSSPCLYGNKTETLKWRTLLFIREFKHNATEDDVTFVSQLSFSKRGVLEEVGKRWSGPMSITFYITDSQLHECLKFIEQSKTLRTRSNIAYHAVFRKGNFYPINTLRNIALRNVVTPYVFLDDIDFLPIQNLDLVLTKYIRKTENMPKKVFVVPAFQTNKFKTKIPRNTRELLKVLYKNVFPFSHKAYPRGHGPTDFKKWQRANEPYKIKWQPGFEPFVVVRRNVTEYDERFVGYAWNKITHILELEAQGYEFTVIPKVFIVHKYHLGSDDKRQIYGTYRECMENLYQEFISELEQKYGRKFNI